MVNIIVDTVVDREIEVTVSYGILVETLGDREIEIVLDND